MIKEKKRLQNLLKVNGESEKRRVDEKESGFGPEGKQSGEVNADGSHTSNGSEEVNGREEKIGPKEVNGGNQGEPQKVSTGPQIADKDPMSTE